MPAAPLPVNDSGRLKALLNCQVLDTPPEQRFDQLTALASRLCQTPIALVSLVDQDRQWFKSHHGLGATQTPRDQAFCGYAILQDEPLVINDATKDPRTADNPLVLDDPKIRFYAGVPLRLSDGATIGTLCVIDTRPRELSEEQIHDLQALARQTVSQLELNLLNVQLSTALESERLANEAKSTFLANMSHEIRTPLTAILGFSEILKDRSSNESDRDSAAKTIHRNGEHLLALVSDILDVSKIEAGEFEVESIQTPLQSLLNQAAQLYESRAADKGLQLSIMIDGQTPSTIHTDPTRLSQALFNLVSNAIKFTESGSVAIIARHLPDQQLLELAVRDTGIGINPGQIEQIFKPFSQADASMTRQFGGTGLGLTITQQIAKLLGGELAVHSEHGKGSTFTLTVATGDVSSTMINTTVPGANVPTADLAAHPAITGHVLLVEDGVDNQRLIAYLLRKAGATVTLCENGQDGMDAALTGDADGRPFDLVLMDMHMPVMSGYEATTNLRKRGYAGQIIALTANVLKDEREKCIQAGCDDYLTKPIIRASFLPAIAQRIGKPSKRSGKPSAA